MANRLQHLRGSEAEHSTFTGAKGEISLVTDTSSDRIPTGEVRVHDGTTAGGLPLTLGTTSKPLTNNIVLSSGVGINFNNYGSEDSNSATTVGSNLLDDYEEGSWTPTANLNCTVGTVTSATYTKIGRLVHIQAVFSLTYSGSGQMRIDGLPFDAIASESAGIAIEVSSVGELYHLTPVSATDLAYVQKYNGGAWPTTVKTCQMSLTYETS